MNAVTAPSERSPEARGTREHGDGDVVDVGDELHEGWMMPERNCALKLAS